MNRQAPQEYIEKDGFVYRLQRPLHKQTLFWVSLISVILIFLLSLLSILLVLTTIGLVRENDQLKSMTEGSISLFDGYRDYSFGQTVSFDSGLEVTVHSITADAGRTMSDESTGQALVASVTVKNTSDRSILVSPYDFELYDAAEDIYVLDSSTFDNTQVGTNLPVGRSVRLDLVFDGENSQEEGYRLTYEDVSWSQGKSRKDDGSSVSD